jgi:hypothetical protein
MRMRREHFLDLSFLWPSGLDRLISTGNMSRWNKLIGMLMMSSIRFGKGSVMANVISGSRKASGRFFPRLLDEAPDGI